MDLFDFDSTNNICYICKKWGKSPSNGLYNLGQENNLKIPNVCRGIRCAEGENCTRFMDLKYYCRSQEKKGRVITDTKKPRTIEKKSKNTCINFIYYIEIYICILAQILILVISLIFVLIIVLGMILLYIGKLKTCFRYFYIILLYFEYY